MGRSPYPLCAASAAGSTLGPTENAETERNKRGADEHRQQRIGGHDVPDVADQGSQSAGVTKDGSDSSSGILNAYLLFMDLWLRGEESNPYRRIQSPVCYLYTTPRCNTLRYQSTCGSAPQRGFDMLSTYRMKRPATAERCSALYSCTRRVYFGFSVVLRSLIIC